MPKTLAGSLLVLMLAIVGPVSAEDAAPETAGESGADETPDEAVTEDSGGEDAATEEAATEEAAAGAVGAEEAAAGEATAEPETSLLVWGPSTVKDGEARARRALATFLGDEANVPERGTTVARWLGKQRFRVSGSSRPVPCSAPPSGIELEQGVRNEVQALTAKGIDLLDNLDPTGALELFQQARDRIPCQDTFVAVDDYWESFFYSGIAAYYLGDMEAAQGWFANAVTVDPRRGWDPSYPVDPQTTYLNVMQEVIAQPRARLVGDLTGTDFTEVRADGVELALDKNIELELPPGQHLLQAVDAQGRWSTWVRDAFEGSTITVFSAAGYEAMVLDGESGKLANLASVLLKQQADEESLAQVYVLRLDPHSDAVSGQVFQVETRSWERIEQHSAGPTRPEPTQPQTVTTGEPEPEPLTQAEKNKQALLREADYRSSAGIGFRAIHLQRCSSSADANGRCADGQANEHSYVGGLISIGVRLVKGLDLDVRFGTTVSVGDINEGGTLLPEAQFGFRYRFLQGTVQPFLGGAFDLMFGTTRSSIYSKTDTFTIYLGPQGYGGVEFEFPDGFRVALEGGVGLVAGGESQQLTWPYGVGMFSIGRFMP